MKERRDKCGFNHVLDDESGWEHSVCVPMIILRPQADPPVIQISIPTGLNNSKQSLKLGQALKSFRDNGYMILSSGSSYHNFDAIIPAIMGVPDAADPPNNRPFKNAMEEVALMKDGEQMVKAMAKWREMFPIQHIFKANVEQRCDFGQQL